VHAPVVTRAASLTGEQAAAIVRLRDEITRATGVSPLSDHVVGAVRARADGQHFVQAEHGDIVGYAHVESSGRIPVAELIVAPSGDVVGLLEAVGNAAGPTVRVWTRGDAAPLNDVLPKLGYTLTRTLLQLRRPLAEPPLPEPRWPDGVSVRTFRVGEDEAAWLAVNNEAFAGHPEQSGWTLDEIHAREREAWFDPEGFFVAELEGRVVGFHWTKHHSEVLGEVYVIGVGRSMQGKRLGEALLLHGLRHLRESGLETVLLYVESDNRPALALYKRLGFTRWDADRMFSRPHPPH
jgi:mycothiol synthase